MSNSLLLVTSVATAFFCIGALFNHFMVTIKPLFKKVSNKNRKFGAETEYYFLNAGHNGNEWEGQFLFTEKELINAKERAVNNIEDFQHLL